MFKEYCKSFKICHAATDNRVCLLQKIRKNVHSPLSTKPTDPSLTPISEKSIVTAWKWWPFPSKLAQFTGLVLLSNRSGTLFRVIYFRLGAVCEYNSKEVIRRTTFWWDITWVILHLVDTIQLYFSLILNRLKYVSPSGLKHDTNWDVTSCKCLTLANGSLFVKKCSINIRSIFKAAEPHLFRLQV